MNCLSSSKILLLSAAIIVSLSACSSKSEPPSSINDAVPQGLSESVPQGLSESMPQGFENGLPEAGSTSVPIASGDNLLYTPEPDISATQADSAQTVLKEGVPLVGLSETDADLTKPVSFAANTQNCPDSFYQTSLPENGKLCQVFAADLPASMIFFVPQAPQAVIDFYQQDSANFDTPKQVKDRFVMHSSDKRTTLIISNDGSSGTQVDILVKE